MSMCVTGIEITCASPAPWKALVAKRLEALGAPGRSLVSDRAPALIQRAEPGLECLRMPAVFPLVHVIVDRYALAMGRQWGQARQEWQQAQDGFQRHQERAQRYPAVPAATRHVEAAHAQGQ